MYEKFKKEKDEGLSGLNKGISFPLVRFNQYIPGVRRERLYLIGGGSGSGKSKVTNELFVFNVFDDWLKSGKKYTLDIHYFSLEMPESQIISELASRWIYNTHGLLVDSQYLLSHWADYTLALYVNELLESDEFKQYVKEFQSCVTILDMTLNSVGFSKYIDNLARSKGQIHTKEVKTKEGNVFNMFDSYTENDKEQTTIIVLDHISLVKTVTISGQSQNRKTMIDDMAEIMIKARNRYKFTFAVAQQLNRGFNSTDRIKLDDVLPKDSDFRDGSGMFDAANVVLGLMSPIRERHTSFLGYKVASNNAGPGFGNRLLILNIIKNRHGAAFGVFPLLFLGETGQMFELPKRSEDFNMDELKKYKKYYIK